MEQSIWQLLLTPFSYPFDPSKRIFWGFLISSMLLAIVAVIWQQRRLDWRYLFNGFFSKDYWLHKSHCQDVFYALCNPVIKGVLLIPLVGSQIAMTMWVASTLQTNFGDSPLSTLAVSWLIIGLLYTLSFFIIEDFSRFGLHWLMHRVPLLWYFHKTHHSAERLSPLTVHRVHPIEMSLYYLRSILVFGLISGIFVYLFQSRVHGFDILGVDALGFLFNALGANLRHSPIWVSFGKFERWFISPAQHQIHHSVDPAHYNKNYGTCLALWDHLVGSWHAAGKKTKLRFGVA